MGTNAEQRRAAQADDRERQIDWSSAVSEGGTLKVQLDQRASRAWEKGFAGVLALLDHGGQPWGSVNVKKQTIEVDGLQEGSEADLRHLLESVVLQVDAQLAPEEGEDSQAPVDAEAESDRRMTDRFRSFAD